MTAFSAGWGRRQYIRESGRNPDLKSGVKGEHQGSAMEEEEKGTEMLASVMQIKV